jgi:hypothetical protein
VKEFICVYRRVRVNIRINGGLAAVGKNPALERKLEIQCIQ